ncbi:MAG: carboxypeptidase-like regulatory domain-containing protein [Bryobacter sp.]|nr:carboxypeptidase-like regulatory domain-containing protein [Bryobacter sp.]
MLPGDDYALIAGTVYRETGHAFPNVSVLLSPLAKAKGAKKQSQRTTPRGEFFFRVPARPLEYEISIAVEGYQPVTKRVKIEADERVDLSFPLDRAR